MLSHSVAPTYNLKYTPSAPAHLASFFSNLNVPSLGTVFDVPQSLKSEILNLIKYSLSPLSRVSSATKTNGGDVELFHNPIIYICIPQIDCNRKVGYASPPSHIARSTWLSYGSGAGLLFKRTQPQSLPPGYTSHLYNCYTKNISGTLQAGASVNIHQLWLQQN